MIEKYVDALLKLSINHTWGHEKRALITGTGFLAEPCNSKRHFQTRSNLPALYNAAWLRIAVAMPGDREGPVLCSEYLWYLLSIYWRLFTNPEAVKKMALQWNGLNADCLIVLQTEIKERTRMNDLHLTQPRAYKSQILLTITLHGVHDLAMWIVEWSFYYIIDI